MKKLQVKQNVPAKYQGILPPNHIDVLQQTF